MSTTETIQAWSTTPATNATADAAITSADTQSPDTVDNNIRSVMAAAKKFVWDISGKLVAGGTANALTVTTNQVIESGQVTDGLYLKLRAASDNTSATVTFAPDGLTAANIKRADGSALAVGSIKSGMYLDLVYNSGSSEWRCANIGPAAGADAGAVRASFRVTKSANQTVSTASATKITWDTEGLDTGSFFDAVTNSRWTPPAGFVLLSAFIKINNGDVADSYTCYFAKNGAIVGMSYVEICASTTFTISFDMTDSCNGTDYYEMFIDSGADTSYIVATTGSQFCGTMI